MSELPRHPVTPVPSTVLSLAKRIEAFTGNPSSMISLARGLAVIHTFQERRRHLTIVQISHHTRVPRAAVRRCLYTLMQLGYAIIDRRTYSLLPKVFTLDHAHLSLTPLAIIAQPILDRLSERLHEVCSMATPEDDDVLYITRSTTSQRLISMSLSVGSRLSAYYILVGRVLLAALDDDALYAYFDGVEMQTRTNRTLRTPKTLLSYLTKTRRQDWYTVDQELEIGLRSLMVPIRGSAGHALAAPSASTHARRVPRAELESRLLPLLLETSRGLSARLLAQRRG